MNLELIIATNNESKIEEFGHVFTQNGYKLRTLRDIAVESDPEETGTTYEENAIIKAMSVWDATIGSKNIPIIASDCGLEIDALDGQPGLYTKRFACPGMHIEKVLRMMENVPPKERTAKLVCALCYIDPWGVTHLIRREVPGRIAESSRGDHPVWPYNVFIPDGHDITFVEFDEDTRKSTTHRSLAAADLLSHLVGYHWVDSK